MNIIQNKTSLLNNAVCAYIVRTYCIICITSNILLYFNLKLFSVTSQNRNFYGGLLKFIFTASPRLYSQRREFDAVLPPCSTVWFHYLFPLPAVPAPQRKRGREAASPQTIAAGLRRSHRKQEGVVFIRLSLRMARTCESTGLLYSVFSQAVMKNKPSVKMQMVNTESLKPVNGAESKYNTAAFCLRGNWRNSHFETRESQNTANSRSNLLIC